jgi:hypothetical protein
MEENNSGLLLCSKSTCKAILPIVSPGQKGFKTCEKCRERNRTHMKRKREEERPEGQRPAPDLPHGLHGSRSDILTKETDREQLSVPPGPTPESSSDEEQVSMCLLDL